MTAIYIIAKSWEQIAKSILIKSWKKLWSSVYDLPENKIVPAGEKRKNRKKKFSSMNLWICFRRLAVAQMPM